MYSLSTHAVGLAFSDDSFLKVKSESESRVGLFATSWTTQAMEFSRPEY